jgi:uncharacterized protein
MMPEMPRDRPPKGRFGTHRRHTLPAGRVLVVMLVCLLTWTVLYAPSLERASEAQPLGTRRTVSLWVLRPLASISNVLQLTKVTDAAARALGRDPEAAPGGQGPDELPTLPPGVSVSPAPQGPVTKSTPMRRPTPDDELRVVVVGDSLAAGLGVYLEREFRPSLARVSKQGRISTGLSRLDYFDWLSAMRQIERDYRPDLVVVMIGDNDNQGLMSPNGGLETPIGSYAWPQGYRDRVEELTRIAVDGGSHIVWVGLPIVDKKDRWPVMQRQNQIFEQVIAKTPNAAYVDTWDRFANADGGYTPFYWQNGQPELIRATDGFHFNPRGYELVAQSVTQAVVDKFKLTPRALNG